MNPLQGPPPDPGSEKRILLAFVLTFVVIIAMQPLVSRYVKPAQPPTQQASQPAQTPPSPAAAPSAATPPPSPVPTARKEASKKGKTAQAPVPPTKQASAEFETVIDNDLYRITFTNRGAQVKSWVLKKYDDEKRKPLELVHTAAAQQYGYPLSLWTWDEALRKKLNSALYLPHDDGPPDSRPCSGAGECGNKTLTAPATVTFEYSDGALSVRKTFAFDHSYVVRVETRVEQEGAPVAALVAWPAGFGDQATPSSYASGQITYQYLDTVERIAAKKISGGHTINGPLQWAGAGDQYFAAVFLPDDPQSAALVTLESTLQLPRNPEKPDPNDKPLEEPVVGMAAGNMNGVTAGRFFAGPKALQVLDLVHSVPVAAGGRMVSPDLEKLVDFGKWFGFLARPLFLWLEWTHDHWVANWGWSIIILTLIITAAVMPLRVTSMKSALKMQRFQPQMKAIQERYKQKAAGLKMADPRRQEIMQQQNQELSVLYKKEGINPAGGCVPMLLQMPFLIAFYSMLGVTIELRHAGFFWVHDLSSADPWHILPILVAACATARRAARCGP